MLAALDPAEHVLDPIVTFVAVFVAIHRLLPLFPTKDAVACCEWDEAVKSKCA